MDAEGMKAVSVIASTRVLPSASPSTGSAKRSGVSRRALGCFAALAMTAGFLSQAVAQAQPPVRGADRAPDAIAPLLGAWDVEKVGASRKCTITLGVEEAPHGRQLRFPATCRRALPILSAAASWTVTAEGKPRLNDALGKPVLIFGETGAEGGFDGKTGDGQQYRLDPKGYPRSARRPQPSAAEMAATAAQRPTAVDLSRAPAAESLPGRYSVMRQPNREACRIVLNAGPPASSGRLPAAFEGNCADTGMTIFDPAGWRYAAGRLSLIARKGHSVELVFENGQWRKDPAVGATLLLKKLP